LNHDSGRIVGHADEVTVTARALKLSGVISGASPEAEQVKASAGLGFPWKASVGARPDKMEFVGEDVTTKANGKTFKGPIYVARKSTLGEVSFVPMAADSKTAVTVAASAAISEKENDMDYETRVKALFGGKVPELQEVDLTALKATFDREVAEKEKTAPSEPGKKIEAKADPPQFDLRGVVLAHEKHVATIEAHVATYAEKIEAAPLAKIRADGSAEASELKLKALNEEWPVPRLAVELAHAQRHVEVALVRAERPKIPAIHSSNHDIGNEVIEAALCGSAGLRELEETYKPEVLEAADTYRRREGGSIQGLILAAACDNGYTGSARGIHRGNFDEVMRAAMIQASSPSTHTLTTMLSTVGNKFLLEGFSSVEQVYREISDIRPVNDFKAITSYRMLDDMVFEEIGPSGEIKHGTADQESFTNQAKTYAKMFALTRTDIINDDLGAFSTIRTRIGRGSGIKLNQIFWASFLDDATLFNATALASGGHLNLLTAVLGETGIAAANVLLKSKTDGHDNPIDIGGAHLLLTGATLSPTAKKWYVSQEIRDTTASTKTLTTNIYYNTFRPVESRYVTSTTSWYLLPVSGGDMAPMEICFLDGVQSPTIESADADFNTLGIQFRGYFDFGVAKKEWRASVKSTGAG
ncbi:MAG TPA: hypothetical protein VMX74_07435, partial [Pirellulales bacterium]|nr:hypothetical protein [Pirellulales bacterium]